MTFKEIYEQTHKECKSTSLREQTVNFSNNLYHGSPYVLDSIDTKKLNYKIFWTTDDIKIAEQYAAEKYYVKTDYNYIYKVEYSNPLVVANLLDLSNKYCKFVKDYISVPFENRYGIEMTDEDFYSYNDFGIFESYPNLVSILKRKGVDLIICNDKNYKEHHVSYGFINTKKIESIKLIDSIKRSKTVKESKLFEKYESAKSSKFVYTKLRYSKVKEKLLSEKDPDTLLKLLNNIFYEDDIRFSDEEAYGRYWSFGNVGIQYGSIYEDGSIEIVCDPSAIIENVLYEDSYMYQEFIKAISALVSHELVHRNQLENTPFEYQINKDDLRNSESNATYLSNIKEIDAHAREAITQLIEIGYSKEKILSWLESSDLIKDHASESDALWKYYDYFGRYYNTDNCDEESKQIWKRFLTRFYDFCSRQ